MICNNTNHNQNISANSQCGGGLGLSPTGEDFLRNTKLCTHDVEANLLPGNSLYVEVGNEWKDVLVH